MNGVSLKVGDRVSAHVNAFEEYRGVLVHIDEARNAYEVEYAPGRAYMAKRKQLQLVYTISNATIERMCEMRWEHMRPIRGSEVTWSQAGANVKIDERNAMRAACGATLEINRALLAALKLLLDSADIVDQRAEERGSQTGFVGRIPRQIAREAIAKAEAV